MSEEGNIYNPIRYKGYYYDIETNMFIVNPDIMYQNYLDG